jgi:hypothetical protein
MEEMEVDVPTEELPVSGSSGMDSNLTSDGDETELMSKGQIKEKEQENELERNLNESEREKPDNEDKSQQVGNQVVGTDQTDNFFKKYNCKEPNLIERESEPKDLSRLYYDDATKLYISHIQETLREIYPQNDCFQLDTQKLNGQFRVDFVVLTGGIFWLLI